MVVILSIIYSFCIMAVNLDNILSFSRGIYDILSLLLCSMGIYLCVKKILEALVIGLRKNYLIDTDRKVNTKRQVMIFIVSFFLLMIIWGIGLAISYPANMTRDSRTSFEEFMGSIPLTARNPIIYTMSLKVFYALGYDVFGNVNAGVACCSIAQFTFLALIIAYLIYKLYCCNIKKAVCILIFVFYAFIPYNAQLSHTLWKDIPFAGFVFLYMLYLWDYYQNEQTKKSSIKILKFLFFVLAGVGVCLFRHNGLYAFIFFVPFGIVMFAKKSKIVIGGFFISFILAMLIQSIGYDYIYNRANQKELNTEVVAQEQVVEPVKNVNAARVGNVYVSLIMQPMARVVAEREFLDEEDYIALSKIFDMEEVGEKYNPHVYDSIFWVMKFESSPKEIYKLWFRLGIKYPSTYFKAIVDQTYGYWYPDVQGWVYDDYIKENDLNIYKDSVFSDDFLSVLRRIEDCYVNVPIYGLLWSIGFVVWITFFMIGMTIIKKDIRASFCYALLLGIWITLILATPIYDDFRYIYSFFLALPLSMLIPFVEKQER